LLLDVIMIIMNIIKKESTIQLEQKKSKFITYSYCVNNEIMCKKILDATRKKHKGASHVCYAWRLLKDNGQIYIKRSDDGEPSGTAGAPMMAQLIGLNLIGILIITVRYYGGIKLGTGGLTSMYKKGIKEVLNDNLIVPYQPVKMICIQTNLSSADSVIKWIFRQKYQLLRKEFSDVFIVEFSAPMDQMDEIKLYCLYNQFTFKDQEVD